MGPRSIVRALLALLVLCAPMAARAGDSPADVLLSGEIGTSDLHTYVEAPFDVPAGVSRLSVSFHHDGAAQRTTIDLGLFDPDRFRGWSGGDKSGFTVSATDATPSYLPGALPPGRWRLLLGVPNIRQGVTTHYEARIHFDTMNATPAFSHFSDHPLRTGPGWFRGDLHMHTGHSDGHCRSQAGASTPCPVFRTVETAVARGLDFISVTDHNTTSHAQDLRDLQPFFDQILLIPGREMTTFTGHGNAFGVIDFIDFRIDGRHLPDANAMVDGVHRAGGVFSINHPSSPSGEVCMGCGWTAPGFDMSRADAVEVVNGGGLRSSGSIDGPTSGLGFWQGLLNQGLHPTAIGGSDSHDADALSGPGAIGSPTTVVYADNLSERAILAGLRTGRVFIDIDGVKGRSVDLSARAGERTARMGDALHLVRGQKAILEVEVSGVPGGHVEFVADGKTTAEPSISTALTASDHRAMSLAGDGGRHWINVRVRDAAGRLVLISNPVFVVPEGIRAKVLEPGRSPR